MGDVIGLLSKVQRGAVHHFHNHAIVHIKVFQNVGIGFALFIRGDILDGNSQVVAPGDVLLSLDGQDIALVQLQDFAGQFIVDGDVVGERSDGVLVARVLRVSIQPLHPLQQVVLVVDDHVRRVLQDAGVVQNHYHALDLLVSRVNAVHDAFGNQVRTFTLCLLGQVNVLHDTLVRVDGQHQGLFIALECGQHHEGFDEIAFGIVTGSTGLQGQVFLCEDGLAVLIIRTFTQL